MTVTSLIHVLIQTSRINLAVISSIVFSFLGFLGFTLIFDIICVNCIQGENPYQVSYQTFRQSRFWFTNILAIVTAMLPRFTIKSVYNSIRNPLMQNI